MGYTFPLRKSSTPRRFSKSRTCTRLASRTKRVAAKSIAAIPAEAIPFLGVAVLIADTGYELYAACETSTDLDQLYAELGMADETPDDAMHSACDPELPDAGEVWGGVCWCSRPYYQIWPVKLPMPTRNYALRCYRF